MDLEAILFFYCNIASERRLYSSGTVSLRLFFHFIVYNFYNNLLACPPLRFGNTC